MVAQGAPAVSAAGPKETPGNHSVVVLRATIEELVYKIRLVRLCLEPRFYYGMGHRDLIRLAKHPLTVPQFCSLRKQFFSSARKEGIGLSNTTTVESRLRVLLAARVATYPKPLQLQRH
jgi:hypothetical protein